MEWQLLCQMVFMKKSLASVTVYFESQETIVTALKEDFTTLEAINLGKNSTFKDKDKYEDTFLKWAKTVSFS